MSQKECLDEYPLLNQRVEIFGLPGVFEANEYGLGYAFKFEDGHYSVRMDGAAEGDEFRLPPANLRAAALRDSGGAGGGATPGEDVKATKVDNTRVEALATKVEAAEVEAKATKAGSIAKVEATKEKVDSAKAVQDEWAAVIEAERAEEVIKDLTVRMLYQVSCIVPPPTPPPAPLFTPTPPSHPRTYHVRCAFLGEPPSE